MTTSSTLDFLLTDPAEGDPTRQALLEQVRQEFFTAGAQQKLQELDARLPKAGSASLAAGEEAAITIKMNELLAITRFRERQALKAA